MKALSRIVLFLLPLILAVIVPGCSWGGLSATGEDRRDHRSNAFHADGRARAPISANGKVVAVGDMTVARAAHTATLLSDDRVLIAGGCTLDSCEIGDGGATAELYDPNTRSFARTGRMSSERVSHTATLLSNSKVLVAGGWGRDGVLASAEMYDPATRAFSPAGTMTSGRAAHTATLLPGGKILITGGNDSNRSLASAEIYHPQTGTFTRTGSMTTPRSAHAAALLPDGRVLVTGGSDSREDVLASAEVYDPSTGEFARTGDMTVGRYKHAATTLRDGKILVLGGSDGNDFYGKHASAELFDPETFTFTAVTDMNAERFKLPDAVAALSNGEVLVGGDGEHAEIYDPALRAFHTVQGDLGAAHMFATATPLPEGRALIAGGYDQNTNVTKKVWLYVPGE